MNDSPELNVKHARCETHVDKDNPHGTLIWSMRPDPDIVVICHVAMSSPTSEHRQRLIKRLKQQNTWIASGFSDSVSSLRCFLWICFHSIFLYCLFTPHLSSAHLFVLSLADPGPSLHTMGFGIYDPVSNTYPETYPQRAFLYLKPSLCSFIELSEHSLWDLVLCHCNSLFLMFLMCIHRHPGGLFIFQFSCFCASTPSPLLCFYILSSFLKTRCFCDRNVALQVWFNVLGTSHMCQAFDLFVTHVSCKLRIMYMRLQ